MGKSASNTGPQRSLVHAEGKGKRLLLAASCTCSKQQKNVSVLRKLFAKSQKLEDIPAKSSSTRESRFMVSEKAQQRPTSPDEFIVVSIAPSGLHLLFVQAVSASGGHSA